MNDLINIGLCGAEGYAGKELLKLIQLHPKLKLTGIIARKTKAQLYQSIPTLGKKNIPVFSTDDMKQLENNIQVLLLATPPNVSMELVTKLRSSTIKIIDLSGAFRLNLNEFQQFYGMKHLAPELLMDTPYGLSPWEDKTLKDSNVIANPGCYATCALMALIPLLKQNIIKQNTIIIDAKSGTSGAGKNPKQNLMFSEMYENFFPYKINQHQHHPEIIKALQSHTNKSCQIQFVTHLLPISRGISMSIYADANEWLTSATDITYAIEKSFKDAYEAYPLVEFAEINNGNTEKDKFLLSLKSVVGTAKIHMGYCIKGTKIFIFACIDNLLKGAASQAIENINTLYNFPIETGLLQKEAIL